jgi:NADH-quinone oxidoreductase subunit F
VDRRERRRGLQENRPREGSGHSADFNLRHVERPGVYEIECGYPFHTFIFDDCGGGLGGRPIKAIIPAGISTKVLTGKEIEKLTLDNPSLTSAGSSMDRAGWS